MFQCYLEEQGIWCYPSIPQKRIKIRLEKINGNIQLIIRKEVEEGKRIKKRKLNINEFISKCKDRFDYWNNIDIP